MLHRHSPRTKIAGRHGHQPSHRAPFNGTERSTGSVKQPYLRTAAGFSPSW